MINGREKTAFIHNVYYIYYFLLDIFSFLNRAILWMNGETSGTAIFPFLFNTTECFQLQLTELTHHISLADHNQNQKSPNPLFSYK